VNGKFNIMPNFIYATDLHGDITKYDKVLEYAIELNVKLIHIGADILPKGSGILEIQKKFVNGYLKEFYKKAKEEGIQILAFFGNDDIYTRKKYFKNYGALLDEVPFQKDGYDFKAYGYVPDYKFGLKTACKWDSPGWRCPEPYLGAPVDFNDQGRVIIEDIEGYFKNKGSIEDDLRYIPTNDKTIMAIHSPPAGVELDVCLGGRQVGSKAVFEWIRLRQPKLVLCGHIHENYKVTRVWKTKIGNTTVIQPGQEDFRTTMVYVEVHDDKIVADLAIV
jgi:Icc-related predicted phosphoesterase